MILIYTVHVLNNINDPLNEREFELVNIIGAKLGLFEATTDHTTITDTSVYTFPDNTVKIHQITYNGKKLKQDDFRGRERLDGADYGYTPSTGNPEIWIPWNNQVTLSPVPDAAKALKFYFKKTPATITTSSTVFSIQEDSITQMLPDYAIWKGSMKDQELNRADRHLAAWNANVQTAAQIWDDKKYDDRILSVKDEDDYYSNYLGMT